LLPAAAFLLLALLPRGRTALAGCGLAGLGIVFFWVYVLIVAAPGGGTSGSYTIVIAALLTGALGVASSLQALRLRLPPGGPAWRWPAIVAITLLAVGLPALRLLGV